MRSEYPRVSWRICDEKSIEKKAAKRDQGKSVQIYIPFCDDQTYYCAIYIENLGDDEQLNMLLEFMYYYMKLYPEHVFFHYGGIDWFYTKSDIDTIYESGDWQDWCYIKPPK